MAPANPHIARKEGIMADTIYRIAMRAPRVTSEPVPPAWQGLGGRALTSTIVAAR